MAQEHNLDLPHKQQTFHGFVRLAQWVIAVCAVVIVLLAIFTV